jgi:hypothetical protein
MSLNTLVFRARFLALVIIPSTLPTLRHHPPHPVTMSTPFTTDAKKMLEEILASTTDLQKHMVAQEDKLVTLSDKVSSLKVDQE